MFDEILDTFVEMFENLTPEKIIKICIAVLTIAKELGLFDEDINPEEFGAKVIQARENGVVPGNYNAFSEYVKNVENYKLAPKELENIKLNKNSDELYKEAATAVGHALKKSFPDFPLEQSIDFINVDKKLSINEMRDRLGEIASLFKVDPELVKNAYDFLSGVAQNEITIKSVVEALSKIEQKLEPGLSDDEAKAKVWSVRSEV